MKVNGKRITDAGLIGEVTHETRAKVRMVITDLFFPRHNKSHGSFQVDPERREHLRNVLIGQEREFWKTGPRAGFEVGGNRFVTEWQDK